MAEVEKEEIFCTNCGDALECPDPSCPRMVGAGTEKVDEDKGEEKSSDC